MLESVHLQDVGPAAGMWARAIPVVLVERYAPFIEAELRRQEQLVRGDV